MKHRHESLLTLCFSIMTLIPLTLQAGALNPSTPPSADGTMKTLDEVEPRIPIRQADIPLTISTSGSYYLAENVTAATGRGITVDADNVTIDLCGFTLAGPDTPAVYGIYMNGRDNVEIRNGTIRDFYNGIYEMSSDGKNHRIINVRVLSNVGNGIRILGRKCLVKDCLVADNGASSAVAETYGIHVGNGSTITGNTVCNNGYQASSTLFYAIHTGFGCTITGNTVYENGTEKTGGTLFGIQANTGSTIANNVTYHNGKSATNATIYGLYANSGCTVTGNTACFNGLSATGSVVYGLIASNSLVDQNTAYSNNGTNLSAVSCALGINQGL